MPNSPLPYCPVISALPSPEQYYFLPDDKRGCEQPQHTRNTVGYWPVKMEHQLLGLVQAAVNLKKK